MNPTKKILITGISGFAGSFLAEHLLSQGRFDVFGTYLLDKSLGNLTKVKNKISLSKVNLLSKKKVSEIVSHLRPDVIFHLAALTSPMVSFDAPFETFRNNIEGEINLLEAVKNSKLSYSKILIVSSAEIYGIVKKEDIPIDEKTEFMPTNPYAVSKIAQDFLGLQYFLSHKLQIIRVRPFNHIGPRQSPDFVVSSFAKKIAEMEKRRDKILMVGNLESLRDFTDVRDVVRAYLLAIEKGKVGDVYNIGSGKSYKISEILKKLLSLSRETIKIVTDESLLRPSDNPILLCDRTKFSSLTGWEPKIPIEKTLEDTLDYWRNII